MNVKELKVLMSLNLIKQRQDSLKQKNAKDYT